MRHALAAGLVVIAIDPLDRMPMVAMEGAQPAPMPVYAPPGPPGAPMPWMPSYGGARMPMWPSPGIALPSPPARMPNQGTKP